MPGHGGEPRYGTCPSGEELREYLHNALPDSSIGSIETHLLLCTACQDALEQQQAQRQHADGSGASVTSSTQQEVLAGVELRGHERSQVFCPAVVRARGLTFAAKLLDLSVGGIGLRCDGPFLVDQDVIVTAGDASFEGTVKHFKNTRLGVQLRRQHNPNGTDIPEEPRGCDDRTLEQRPSQRASSERSARGRRTPRE